ncbi:MAG: YkvA family protein [Armatimonadota bacterium]
MNIKLSDTNDETGMKADISRIIQRLPGYGKLIWLLIKEPGLESKHKAALMGAIGYSVSPIDLIPGIFPVVGQMDDLAIVLYTARWILRFLPQERADDLLIKSGLTMQILEEDLSLVQRTGAKILKRVAAAAGVVLISAWGLGKYAARGIVGNLRKRG